MLISIYDNEFGCIPMTLTVILTFFFGIFFLSAVGLLDNTSDEVAALIGFLFIALGIYGAFWFNRAHSTNYFDFRKSNFETGNNHKITEENVEEEIAIKSKDLSTIEAIRFIESKSKSDIKGFLSDTEDREFVKKVYEKKINS